MAEKMKAEDHLNNILKILKINDYEENVYRLLQIYVATRGLDENWYSGISDLDVFKTEIDEILNEENSTD